jgi:hypothetical protein
LLSTPNTPQLSGGTADQNKLPDLMVSIWSQVAKDRIPGDPTFLREDYHK